MGYDEIEEYIKKKSAKCSYLSDFESNPLIDACFHGDVNRLQEILDSESLETVRKYLSYERFSFNLSPLHYAVARGHETCVRLLLQIEGIELNSGEDAGFPLTPLLAGCHNLLYPDLYPEKAILALLEADGVQLSGYELETPLHYAVLGRSLDVIKRLHELGADFAADPCKRCQDNQYYIEFQGTPLDMITCWPGIHNDNSPHLEKCSNIARYLMTNVPEIYADGSYAMKWLVANGILEPVWEEFVDAENSPPGLRVLKDGKHRDRAWLVSMFNSPSPTVMQRAVEKCNIRVIKHLLSLRVNKSDFKKGPKLRKYMDSDMVPACSLELANNIRHDRESIVYTATAFCKTEDLQFLMESLSETYGKNYIQQIGYRAPNYSPLHIAIEGKKHDALAFLATYYRPERLLIRIEKSGLKFPDIQSSIERRDMANNHYVLKTSQPLLLRRYKKVDPLGWLLLIGKGPIEENLFFRPDEPFYRCLHPPKEVIPPVMALLMSDRGLEEDTPEGKYLNYLVSNGCRLRLLKEDVAIIVERILRLTSLNLLFKRRAFLAVQEGLLPLGWYIEPSVYKVILNERILGLKIKKEQHHSEALKLIKDAEPLIRFVNDFIGNGHSSLLASYRAICQALNINQESLAIFREVGEDTMQSLLYWARVGMHKQLSNPFCELTEGHLPKHVLELLLFKNEVVEPKPRYEPASSPYIFSDEELDPIEQDGFELALSPDMSDDEV